MQQACLPGRIGIEFYLQTLVSWYMHHKKQKGDFFENNSLLPFHFNHVVSFERIFLSRAHEKVFVFHSLLTSWVPTFSFLLLIWRKFNVLLLSAVPAGNLQVVGWKKLSLCSGNTASPTPNTDTHTYTNTVEYNGLTYRMHYITRAVHFHPQSSVGRFRGVKLAAIHAKGRSGSRGRNIPSWGRKIRFVLCDFSGIACTFTMHHGS